jgi:hypothetical protein
MLEFLVPLFESLQLVAQLLVDVLLLISRVVTCSRRLLLVCSSCTLILSCKAFMALMYEVLLEW